MPRYEVKAHWRKPDGDWVGVVGHVPDDYELWYYIEDQDSDADDWTDEVLYPSMDRSKCESKCNELNGTKEAPSD